MTFLQLQNRVMDRLNLTSTEARTRIKAELNDRYREVQSGVNLARTRRTVLSVNTAVAVSTITFPAAKILSVYDAVFLKRPLREVSVNQIRMMDAPLAVTGPPEMYAITAHVNDTVTLLLYPKPTAISALQADAIAPGTEMVADADSPALPTDYHDVLVHGVLADEYAKMEKLRPLGSSEESKFEKRLSELRYFLIKSAYLTLKQTSAMPGLAAHVWPYANLAT